MPAKPQPNQPMYPVSELYLFDQYQTPADYKKANGKDAPAPDVTRRPKTWFDPAAVEIAKRDPDEPINYRIVRRPLGGSGNPVVVSISLPSFEAASVNLFPGGAMTDPTDPIFVARARPPWEVPMRDLLPNEVLGTLPPLGAIIVKRTDIAPPDGGEGGGFTTNDRARLINCERILAAIEQRLA
jgi:hypothetical protein